MIEIEKTESSHFIKRKLLTYSPALLIGICLIGLGIYADRLNTHTQEQELRQSVFEQLSVIRARLEGNINSNAQSVKGLVSAISIEPNMTQERFAAFSKPLFQGHTQLKNIGAAPDLVIRYMFPVTGNEAAIGLDYRKNPAQFDAVKKAIDVGELVLAGPVNLVQGGQGFIARIPIFINDKSESKNNFWGLISAVIDAERLYEASGLGVTAHNLDISIRGKDALGNQGEVFFGRDEIFTLNSVQVDVILPYGSWRLAAVPKGGWSNSSFNTDMFRCVIFAVGFLILIPLLILGRFWEKKRESEALLRGLFELSPVGIALNDYTTGDFISVNDALLAPTGYTRNEFLSLNYWNLTPKEYEAQEILQLESMEKTNKYGPYKKEYIRKNGSHYPVLLHGIVVYDTSGRKLIWSIIEDISERVNAEKNLILARDEADDANKAKSQFLSSMSHEFRTPLNAILGFSQILEIQTTDDNSKESLKEIINAGYHLLDLIDDIMDLSKIEVGKIDLSIKSHKLNDLLSDSLSLIKPMADKRSILIDNQISPSSDIAINVDEKRFKQILLNILSNAVKYNNENGKIIIECSFVEKNILYLSVTDTGEGLTSKQQKNLFKLFDRAGAERSNIEGTGLGLVISKDLIELMGGTIGVESEVGKGSSFWVRVPLS